MLLGAERDRRLSADGWVTKLLRHSRSVVLKIGCGFVTRKGDEEEIMQGESLTNDATVYGYLPMLYRTDGFRIVIR